MAGLTWLHLSDWHQKGKNLDRKILRDAFIKDIEERIAISPDLTKIDFIIFSGDVAYSGGIDEYKMAKKELFDPLLDATELSPKQLFIVPGNHDMDMSEPNFTMQIFPMKSNKEVRKWLDNKESRDLILRPFRNFSRFVSEYTGQNNPDYASVSTYIIEEKTIKIIGLNSAWMCNHQTLRREDSDDYGQVIVGKSQIREALKKTSDADIRIAVLHHPFDLMAEFDRNQVESDLMRQCDFILHGHSHKPAVRVSHGTIGDSIIVPSGKIFDKPELQLPYINSYNFVSLDFDNYSGNIFFRKFNNKRIKWINDIDGYPNGRFRFILEKTRPAKLYDNKIDPAYSHVRTSWNDITPNDLRIAIYYAKSNIEPLKLNTEPYLIPQNFKTNSVINDFRISLIPMDLIYPDYFNIIEGNKYKLLTMKKNFSDVIRKNIVDISIMAAERGAKIIIFSELSYPIDSDKFLKINLSKICNKYNCFIICGSYHGNKGDNYGMNICPIFNPYSSEPVLQPKLHPGKFGKYYESIKIPNVEPLNIFQTIYGNFAVVLGFDIFSSNILNNVKFLNRIPSLYEPLDMLIIPSFTNEEQLIIDFCQQASRITSTYTVCANNFYRGNKPSVFLNGDELKSIDKLEFNNKSIYFYNINISNLYNIRYKKKLLPNSNWFLARWSSANRG
jgi:predicted phosphodiesterase